MSGSFCPVGFITGRRFVGRRSVPDPFENIQLTISATLTEYLGVQKHNVKVQPLTAANVSQSIFISCHVPV